MNLPTVITIAAALFCIAAATYTWWLNHHD